MNRSEFWQDLSEIASATSASPRDVVDLFVEFVLTNFTFLEREDLDRCAKLLIQSRAWQQHRQEAAEHLWALFSSADYYDRNHMLILGLIAYHDQEELATLVEKGTLAISSIIHIMWLFRYTEPDVSGLYMNLLCALGEVRWSRKDLACINGDVNLYLLSQACDEDAILAYASLLLLLVISNQFEDSGINNEVLSVLESHKTRFRSLGAALVILWNRSSDSLFGILLSRFMRQAFAHPETADFLYTNDLIVFVEILLRELSEANGELASSYLKVLLVLLQNPTLRQSFTSMKSTIVQTLRLTLDQSSPESAEIASKCLQNSWLGWVTPSHTPFGSPSGKSASASAPDDSDGSDSDDAPVPPPPRSAKPPVPQPRHQSVPKVPPPPPPSRRNLSI